MEKYEIGDWVIVTERHATNSALVGDFCKLNRIDELAEIKYGVFPQKSGGFYTWCKNIRKATPEEVEKHTGISTICDNYEIY